MYVFCFPHINRILCWRCCLTMFLWLTIPSDQVFDLRSLLKGTRGGAVWQYVWNGWRLISYSTVWLIRFQPAFLQYTINLNTSNALNDIHLCIPTLQTCTDDSKYSLQLFGFMIGDGEVNMMLWLISCMSNINISLFSSLSCGRHIYQLILAIW